MKANQQEEYERKQEEQRNGKNKKKKETQVNRNTIRDKAKIWQQETATRYQATGIE